MLKKLIIWAGIVAILLIAVFLVFGKSLFPFSKTEPRNEAGKINHTPNEKSDVIEWNNPDELVNAIFDNASKGKLPDVSAVAGKTELDAVIQEWGEPDHTTAAGDGEYIDYQDVDLSFGYKTKTVFDVRSSSDNIQKIHYQDIKKLKGNPDDERYYKDDQEDQIILVYQLNDTYQLKWVLPKPTDDEPNPAVHHISVYMDPANLTIEQTGLLESLTMDEKIGQMIMAGIEGTTATSETSSLIQDYRVGGIIFYGKNLSSYSQSLNLVNEIKESNADNKVPLLLSTDQEGGRVTRLPELDELPTNKAIGLRNDQNFSYKMGALLARELKAFGMNFNFAPVVDVNSNPNNPIIGDRSFSENPDTVSNLGIQTMKGMADEGVVPVLKHFPGHGDTAEDSHLALPKINKSLEELHELELIPFKNAIEEGADVILAAHILFSQLDQEYPSSMSKPIMTGLLRDKLHFNGVIITDDMVMDAIKDNYEIAAAAVQSVKAGSDIILISGDYTDIVQTSDALKQAVANGEISEERIDESAARILTLKQKYRIHDKQVTEQDIQAINTEIGELLE